MASPDFEGEVGRTFELARGGASELATDKVGLFAALRSD